MSTNKMMNKFRWFLFLLGKVKIPMIGYTNPKLMVLNDETVSVKIKLRRRTRNHLKSMYFGALAVGADLTAGIHAFYFAKMENLNISFAVKGMEAQFLKRAETDVTFTTNQGLLLKKAVETSQQTGERINQEILVEAKNQQNELVATFTMISSVKCK